MEEMNMPCWMLPRGEVDEVVFCNRFVMDHPMVYSGGHFFSEDGMITDMEALRRQIYEAICPYVTRDLARKVDRLVSTLRLRCQTQKLKLSDAVIHTANGKWRIDGEFTERKEICYNRLPVRYNPDAPEPKLWLEFLDELLEPEDILTLQEFMGYCLIPTNVGQKMLVIIGRGGEGKSRIGVVMRGLLGVNMCNGSIAKVESSPFARADLEHRLVMVDDDLKMEALKQTHYLKSIITADTPMDLERKGQQSYQGTLYCRFMAFGNGSIQALYDRSYGFFRRQIILSTKERDPQRVDDPYLGQRMLDELEGILLWAMAGLGRLFANDFRFTISERAQMNMRHSMARGNNIIDFMDSEGYIHRDPMGQCSSRALYLRYKDWCEDNALTPLGPQTFFTYLNSAEETYGLRYTRTVPIGNGLFARGYQGIRLLPRV